MNIGKLCGILLLLIGLLWLLNDMAWFVLAAGIPWGPIFALGVGIHALISCPMCKVMK